MIRLRLLIDAYQRTTTITHRLSRAAKMTAKCLVRGSISVFGEDAVVQGAD